jgi:nucleoside-diphosphate kinase
VPTDEPAVERTLVLVKPDGVVRGLTGEIIGRIERKGLRIVALEQRTLDRSTAEQHYAEHDGKPFFAGLVEFITSGPLVALAVEGESAIEGCRQLMGATNPLKADVGTIRGDFAQAIGRNMVHGSDSPASAERELAIFFDAKDFVTRKHDLERWIIEK